MDTFEEIEDESPCFIVPDSQASENGKKERFNGLALRGLTMLQPSENTGSSSSSDMAMSSSSEAQDTSPSLVSSKDSSSGEKHEAAKEQPLYFTRSEPADKNITPQNMFRTSTPMPQSSGGSYQKMSEKVAHLTPLEPTAECASQQVLEEYKAREASISDDLISPRTSVQESSTEETGQEDKNSVSSDAFQCLHFSGECKAKETSSSDDVISPSISCELLSGSPKNQTGSSSNLPRWQQQILSRPNTSSPVILTRTTSDISTTSSRDNSTQESTMHQWQSNGSDDIFDDKFDYLSKAEGENPQASSVPQLPVYPGLSPPELSQDIFHHRSKGITAEKQHSRHGDESLMVEKLETPAIDKLESSPTDDIILPSQDDMFCLHLTQSQSSAVASQTRSQPNRQTLIDKVTEGTMSTEGNTEIVNNITPPFVTSSSTILPQTPIGHPSTTVHHQDIDKPTDTGSDRPLSISDARVESKMNESTESMESGLVGFHFSPPAMLLKPVPRTTPSCLETSSESIQDLSQEIICSATTSGELCPTSPDLIPSLDEAETTVPVATLSLSVPNLFDANTDDDCQELEFNLQKAVLVPDVDKIAKLPTPSARSVFTNVRERHQPARVNLPDDGIDPFEFRDEVYTSPLRKRKRNRKTGDEQREEERPGVKKKKSRVDNKRECGVNRSKEDQLSKSDSPKSDRKEPTKQSYNERFWKIVKTKTITTTTTLVETKTEITYTAQDGALITKETKHEFSEPTYITTISNDNETREEVDVIPGHITNEEAAARSHTETLVRPTCTQSLERNATSRSTDAETTLDNDQRSSKVDQLARDKGKVDMAPVIEMSLDMSTPSTISSPLFPESCSSTSSCRSTRDNTAGVISTNEGSTRDNIPGRAGKISNTEGNSKAPAEKQMTDASLPKEKRKRSLSVDRQRTSRRCSKSPRGIPLREGTRVLALWYDKHYYPGRVLSTCGYDTKYRIEFDDGDESDIREQCIIVVEYLPCDQPVMFCERTGSEYVDGFIRGFYNNGDERGYKVVGEDNRIVRCSRSDVILSTEQAAIFLSLRESNASSPSLDISPSLSHKEPLQNEVVLRRSREQGTKKLRSCHDDASRDPLCNRDTNTRKEGNIGNVEKVEKHSSTKEQSVETPKSSKKCSGKKTRSARGKVVDNSGIKEVVDGYIIRVRRRLSTVMKSTSDKTNLIPTRKSPRKLGSRGDIGGNNENLILPTNKDLFRGYGFLLTGSDVTGAPGDENSPQEEEQVFIRGQISRQITTGGGEVLTTFPANFQNDSCFLLTNVCQTTAKYFNALVLGVPCLSHAWVRDCCIGNRVVNYKNYLLPAGRDLITERFVEEQNYGNSLQGLKVHLVGEQQFKEQWAEVLNAAGCDIIQKLPTNILQKLQYGENDFVCDVIVVGGGHVSHSTIQKAQLLSIPTVSIHWVKQCILTGRRVDFNAHPSFIYRVEKK